MGRMIIVKVDVKKLKKEWFFNANSGAVFADLALYENDTPDQYGNDWSCKQNPPKEQREAGEKGHYVGNAKNLGGAGGSKPKPQQQRQQPSAKKDEWADGGDDSGVPF